MGHKESNQTKTLAVNVNSLLIDLTCTILCGKGISVCCYCFVFRMRVKKLPQILALHLKRFKYTEQLKRFTKLSYRVVFPLELRLFNTVRNFLSPFIQQNGQNYMYIVVLLKV